MWPKLLSHRECITQFQVSVCICHTQDCYQPQFMWITFQVTVSNASGVLAVGLSGKPLACLYQ